MRKNAKSQVLASAVVLAPMILFGSSRIFYLVGSRPPVPHGPFRAESGAVVELDGESYRLGFVGKDRLVFLAPGRRVFGPLQMVEGRLVRIGGAMYAFRGARPSGGASPGGARPAPAEPFIPEPPPRPEPIPVAAEPPRRSVPARDLPALPRPVGGLAVSAWFAPVDDSPVDWKAGSLSGAGSSIRRETVGADCRLGAFSARLAFSPSVECDGVVPGGVGLAGSSFGDGDGVWLQLGYRRPFLEEGGWTASAGIRGAVRHDKADLTARTLAGGDAGTNGLVTAEYVSETTSVAIDEYSLWLDVGLAYSRARWGLAAGISIQPVSEFRIDGDLAYGGRAYPIGCDRKTPVAFGMGGWCELAGARFFIDASFGAEETLRVGAGYEF